MDFVCKYILASESFLLEYANGGNQKFISLNKIKKLGFPLPPLVEQQNIVSKINNIFTLLTSI